MILHGIGNETFQDLKGVAVAVDDRYFYLADYGAGKVYEWEGQPDENLNPAPKFTIEADGPGGVSPRARAFTLKKGKQHKKIKVKARTKRS